MSETNQMPLAVRIDNDLKQAMRDKDNVSKLTLRAVKTALSQESKTGESHALDEEHVLAVLQREAKRRREAAEEYEKAGAASQAEQELAELAVLERYLPSRLSEEELTAMAREVIAETGAESPRDMGKVMPVLMERAGGRADGKTASRIVRSLLGA